MLFRKIRRDKKLEKLEKKLRERLVKERAYFAVAAGRENWWRACLHDMAAEGKITREEAFAMTEYGPEGYGPNEKIG